jgi:hypothetical protein
MTDEPRRRRILPPVVGCCVVAFAMVACGAVSGSSSSNGGVVPIAQSGTYSYTAKITPPTGVSNQGVAGCSGYTLTLTSDGGTIETLAASGKLYFTAGNWTGALNGSGGTGCQWAVNLTPS